MNPYREILLCKPGRETPARTAMKQAYLDMAKTTDYHDISVKKLCERAYVARTTFYANYSHTDELLQDIENGFIREILKLNLPSLLDEVKKKDVKNSFFIISDFIQRHRETLYILMVARPDYRFMEKWKTAIKYYYWDVIYKDDSHYHESVTVLEMISAMAMADFVLWLKDPVYQDYDEMEKALRYFFTLGAWSE